MSEEEIKILKVLINNKDIFYYEDDFNNRIRPLVGKLLDLYKQEKEKNKELEEKLKIATAMLTKGTYPEENEGDNDFNKKFIAVDKIKEKLENYIISYNDIESNFETTAQQYDTLKELDIKIEILEELLEEV